MLACGVLDVARHDAVQRGHEVVPLRFPEQEVFDRQQKQDAACCTDCVVCVQFRSLQYD